MKKRILIIATVVVSMFTSCMNIDVEPQNAVTFENYFKTEKDIQTFMNSIKSEYRFCMAQSANFSVNIDKGFYADSVSEWGFRQSRALDPFFVHSISNAANNWASFYTLITACNIMLENMDNAEFAPSLVDMYLSQTYFYRAHTYFWLAQNWGEVPLVLHSRKNEAKAKASINEVLDVVVSDALKAVEHLPWYKDLKDERGAASTSRELLTKEAAYSLLAYVYAWRASVNGETQLYKSAIDALTKVLSQEQYYELASSPEEVCTKVFEGGNHKESIFEVQMNWNDNSYRNQVTPAYFITGFPVNPSKKEGDIVDADAKIFNSTVDRMFPKGDLRREAYFYKTDEYRDEASLIFTKGFAYPYKYRYALVENSGTGAGRMIALGNMRVMFRVADLLLLRAECYVRDNQDALAIDDLNRVRSRSNATLYGVKPEPGDLRYTIFKEREKELLWESHRYFDVMRNGYYREISPAYGNLTPNDIKNGATYLPVVFGAFSDNALMTQNKYWLSRY